jgi:hypothetical protein
MMDRIALESLVNLAGSERAEVCVEFVPARRGAADSIEEQIDDY